ncbi:Rz1-like lysis system protein LysC [Budvicia aquatica]|uniref:Rz1-like lysis system protein LysC n=1 Tax=Budvicia aquatica TaxID=82979 RepID=UPI003D155848
MYLFLIPLISSCANRPTESTPLPLPSSLFTPCSIPDYDVVCYTDYPGYVASLMGVIEKCNSQLLGIKRASDSISKTAGE